MANAPRYRSRFHRRALELAVANAAFWLIAAPFGFGLGDSAVGCVLLLPKLVLGLPLIVLAAVISYFVNGPYLRPPPLRWMVPLIGANSLVWGYAAAAMSLGSRVGPSRAALAHRHRLCPTCGYDLRATPGQCPECGTIPGWVARQKEVDDAVRRLEGQVLADDPDGGPGEA